MRKVSLRQLEAAIAEHRKNGTPISDDMRYLAGMQRIQYVFVYPEHNDIVLAGPGEGWKLNDAGRSRRHHDRTGPVLLLDDLLVAFRSVPQAAQDRHQLLDRSARPRASPRSAAMLKNVHAVGTRSEPRDALRSRKSLGPQNDHGHRRAGHEPFRPRAGGGRLSHEAAGDGFRRAADLRPAQLFANAEKVAQGRAGHHAALVAGAELRRPVERSPTGWPGSCARPSVKAMTEEEAISAIGASGSTRRRPIPWPRNGPTT